MFTTIIDWISNNIIALGTGAVGGVVAWPQVQALWGKMSSTASADITALRNQLVPDVATLKTQLTQLQSDIAALKAPPKAS